jgi:hypothetical protein
MRDLTDLIPVSAGSDLHASFIPDVENVSNNAKGVFTSFKIPKFLQDSLSHRIFDHMHGALNIDKK